MLEAVCVNRIAVDLVAETPFVLAELLLVLVDFPELSPIALRILTGMCGFSRIVAEALKRGAHVYALKS